MASAMVFANPLRYLRDLFLMAVAFFVLAHLGRRFGPGALQLVIVSTQGILIGAVLAATALSIRRAE